MEKISKISKTNKIENKLRQQENEKEKSKKNKKTNPLDAYKFEIQKSIITQKKLAQMNNEENEHEEK